jgi:hypothetical protein
MKESKINSAKDRKIKRVAIIGGGIAGLAMASCLRAIPTGVEEAVIFDPSDNVMQDNLGGGIILSGGAYILEKLGYIDSLQYYGKPIEKLRHLTNHGNLILEVNLKHAFPARKRFMNNYTPPSYTLRWSSLRKLLYTCAFNETDHTINPDNINVPKTKIIYRPKRKFHSLEEDPISGKVTLYFSNKLFEGDFDLVIGADGLKSSVRKFTACPNETILTALPIFGRFLPGAYGLQDTGMRVTQCISPPVCDRPQFQASAKAEQMSMHELLEAAHQMSEGKMEQFCGRGVSVLTSKVGDFENTHYILSIIYRDDIKPEHVDDSLDIEPKHHVRSKIEERILHGGFSQQHEFHALLDTAFRPGGLIFDVNIKNFLLPLRSWTSTSGRVVLIGDSAHAT